MKKLILPSLQKLEKCNQLNFKFPLVWSQLLPSVAVEIVVVEDVVGTVGLVVGLVTLSVKQGINRRKKLTQSST